MVARDRQRLLGAKGERRVEDTAQPIKRVGDSHGLCDCLLTQTRPDTGGADVLDQPAQCRPRLDGHVEAGRWTGARLPLLRGR